MPAPAQALLELLDQIRDRVGQPVRVTSGVRCPACNARVGGVQDSAHLTGEAADLACPDSATRWRLLAAAFAAGAWRLGVGSTFVHVDVSRTHPPHVVWLYGSSTR